MTLITIPTAASNIQLIANVLQLSEAIQTSRALAYGHLFIYILAVYADEAQVMAAFVFTSWLTFALAAILGYQNFTNDCCALQTRTSRSRAPKDIEVQQQTKAGGLNQTVPVAVSTHLIFEPPAPSPGPLLMPVDESPTRASQEKDSRWVKIAKGVLAPLCDLQVATGTAILVAGLAQGSALTYYHELIIASYWSLTLNSFWAAQISNPKYSEVNDLPSLVRNMTVLCSAILSVYFQVRATIHQYRPGHWDVFAPGRCFLMHHDHSGEPQAWLWVVGYVSFDYWDAKIVEYFTKLDSYDAEKQRSTLTPNDTCATSQPGFVFRHRQYLETPCRIFAFLITNFFAVWSYGSGSFGVETIAILGYLSSNTLDIIDAKVSNLHLIDPPESETSWGFGQVLPMMLLLTIIFGVFDVFGEENKEESKERQD